MMSLFGILCSTTTKKKIKNKMLFTKLRYMIPTIAESNGLLTVELLLGLD